MESNDQNYKELKNVFASLQEKIELREEETKKYGDAIADTKGAIEDLSKKFAKLDTEIAEISKHNVAQKDTEKDMETLEHKGLRKYLSLNERSILPEEAKAMRSDVGQDGQYLVATDWERSIIRKLEETSNVRSVARVIQGSTATKNFPIETANMEQAIWEGDQMALNTEIDAPKLGNIVMNAQTLRAYVTVTRDMIEDAFVSIEQFLLESAREKFMIQENSAFVNGDGTAKPQGFLNGLPAAQILNSGSATAFDGDDLKALMYQKLNSRYANAAEWAFSFASLGYISTLKATDGNYLLQPGLRDGAPSTLLGKRYHIFDDMVAPASNVYSDGDVPVVLADWRNFYGIYDRIGLSVLVNPFAATPKIRYEFRKRVDGKRLQDDRGVALKTATA